MSDALVRKFYAGYGKACKYSLVCSEAGAVAQRGSLPARHRVAVLTEVQQVVTISVQLPVPCCSPPGTEASGTSNMESAMNGLIISSTNLYSCPCLAPIICRH